MTIKWHKSANKRIYGPSFSKKWRKYKCFIFFCIKCIQSILYSFKLTQGLHIYYINIFLNLLDPFPSLQNTLSCNNPSHLMVSLWVSNSYYFFYNLFYFFTFLDVHLLFAVFIDFNEGNLICVWYMHELSYLTVNFNSGNLIFR